MYRRRQPAASELLGSQDRRGLVGHGGRAHAGHRRLADLVLVDQPAEDLLEGPVAVGHRCRPMAGVLESHQEGLDVLAADGCDIRRHALPNQERIELMERLDVGSQRRCGQVLCSEDDA
jgi:hypothetical protein